MNYNINFPKFDAFLVPILRQCKDEQEHSLSETIDKIASQFNMTDAQKNALLPSGKRTYLYDRVAWAITYLVQAGLLQRTGRSKFKITTAGLSELNIIPSTISHTYLKKFSSFQEFTESKHSKKHYDGDSPSMTPDEELETIFKERNNLLAKNLLSRITNIKPSDFERLIIDLVLALGYGKSHEEMARVLGGSGDQGIDGEISQDKLGFDKIYLQAKKWDVKSSIGSREVRDFIGALTIKNAQKGIFISTALFSKDAIETAKMDTTHKIILIDGDQLARLMIEHGIGVRDVRTYDSKEIDEDYFESF
ncbi:MAG: restriction endonuclease [Nitrososphaerota archaeon]|jgi:restriction system protein|nr:restriction endonuclease [Nitrososphaerota archaeon]MDG7036790.1 restriction endonuclease [Nitrososphaerota archaeon]MDG7039143.1 restriction endonuclease [Nitrososphaerota archaeon]